MIKLRVGFSWLVALGALPAAGYHFFGPMAVWAWATVCFGTFVGSLTLYGSKTVFQCFGTCLNLLKQTAEHHFKVLVKDLVLLARNPHEVENFSHWNSDPLMSWTRQLMGEKIIPGESIARLIQQKAHTHANGWRHVSEVMGKMSQWPIVVGLMASFISLVSAFGSLMGPGADWAQNGHIIFGMMCVISALSISYLFFGPLHEAVREGTHWEMQKARVLSQALPLIAKHSNPIVVLEEISSLLPEDQLPPWEEILHEMKDKAA